MRRTLAVFLFVLLGAVLAASAAATHVVRIPSTITIANQELKFHGQVGSSNAACRAGRNVVLFRTATGPDQKVAATTTKGSGAWKVEVQGTAGISMASIYARVKRRSEGTAGTIYVCGAARSATVPVSPSA